MTMAATIDSTSKISKSQSRQIDFAAIAQTHLEDVYGYLSYLTHNADLAEDLTADSFERALRYWPKYNPKRGEAKVWLLTIARSCALDYFRKEERRVRREKKSFDPLYISEDPPIISQDIELSTALKTLRPLDRELVFLRIVLELENKTVAKLLELTPTNCASRLNRALEKLAKELKND